MSGSQKIDRVLQQSKHLVASFNATGMTFNISAMQIGSGHVDGFQEVLNVAVIFDPELIFYLKNRQPQTPHHIPVSFEQLPGIMVTGILCQISGIQFISRHLSNLLLLLLADLHTVRNGKSRCSHSTYPA